MQALLYFLAGIIFVTYIIPFLDGLLGVFLTWLELLKTRISKKIYQIKQEVEASETISKKIVGFSYEEEDDE